MEPEDDPRVFMAAERTYLAWIRTGIALMAFGFALARFAVFLRQLQAIDGKPVHERSGVSAAFGVTLVLIGVIVNLLATTRHIQLVRNLKSGRREIGISKLGVALAIFLAAIGLAAAGYLISISLGSPSS